MLRTMSSLALGNNDDDDKMNEGGGEKEQLIEKKRTISETPRWCIYMWSYFLGELVIMTLMIFCNHLRAEN